MDNTEETRIISFCTGYGGLELGLHRVIENLRTVVYVEVETFAVANLVAKIEQGKMDAAPIWSDIKTFPAQIFRGKVHGIVGGYPCQPWSNAGKRKGTADPRHLWPYILGHIRTIRPLWCFFENVSGHLTLGFDEVFKSLRDMGYKVEAGLFTAAEVGAPHKRERLFILAVAIGATLGDKNGKIGRGARKENVRQGNGAAGSIRTRPTSELADTDKNEPSTDSREPNPWTDRRNNITRSRYPARPGQPQYEWEEPRTIKSGMGRNVDGFASRVDELRLLGNGVVPATAELAFRTLWEKI